LKESADRIGRKLLFGKTIETAALQAVWFKLAAPLKA